MGGSQTTSPVSEPEIPLNRPRFDCVAPAFSCPNRQTQEKLTVYVTVSVILHRTSQHPDYLQPGTGGPMGFHSVAPSPPIRRHGCRAAKAAADQECAWLDGHSVQSTSSEPVVACVVCWGRRHGALFFQHCRPPRLVFQYVHIFSSLANPGARSDHYRYHYPYGIGPLVVLRWARF